MDLSNKISDLEKRVKELESSINNHQQNNFEIIRQLNTLYSGIKNIEKAGKEPDFETYFKIALGVVSYNLILKEN